MIRVAASLLFAVAGGAVTMGPAQAQADATADLAGHYYLSGVREVGSELLLRPDGQFDWVMSYGAVDQSARGRWRVERDAILLTAKQPDRSAPLFAYRTTTPWTEAAERERRAREQSEREARCAPGTAEPIADPVPSPDARRKTPTRKGESILTPQCQVTADAPPPGPGLAVRIVDRTSGAPLRNVAIALGFADGHTEPLRSGAEGFAFATTQRTTPADRATLHIDQAPDRDTTLSFPPAGSGVIELTIDVPQLIPPAFATLRLRRSGKALLLPDGQPGRYERQP